MTGGPLAGLRVVDMTAVVVGPVATLTLADYGADVIKVEQPGGDLLRRLGGPSRTGQLSPKFLHFNRNKRSIGLDLKHPDGRDVLRRLAAGADILVSNTRPAAMARLGLDPETLRAANSRLIYCGLVGFGEGGRYYGRPAYDTIIQGAGGVSACFERQVGEPRYVPMVMADHVVGQIAVQMILMALYHRERTGEGQTIEVPMLENIATFVLSEHMGQQSFDPPRGATGDLRMFDPSSRPVPTEDGHICVSANTDAQAFAFFAAIGRPELKDDPRFASIKARVANTQAYFDLRVTALAGKATAEWLAIFDRLDVPAAPYNTLESLLQDPHLTDVGLFRTVEHPHEGGIVDIRLPNRMSTGGRTDYQPPPLTGEHTRRVLAELGFDAGEIDRLVAEGSAIAGRGLTAPR